MTEQQLERNKRLLTLKGVPAEEEPSKVEVDSQQILEQYKKKKDSQQNPEKFDALDLKWNPDSTLNRMTAYRNGGVLYTLDFVWDAMGQLVAIKRT